MYFGLYRLSNSTVGVRVFNFTESVNIPIVLICHCMLFRGINSTCNTQLLLVLFCTFLAAPWYYHDNIYMIVHTYMRRMYALLLFVYCYPALSFCCFLHYIYVLVYVVACFSVVFEINSTSNAESVHWVQLGIGMLYWHTYWSLITQIKARIYIHSRQFRKLNYLGWDSNPRSLGFKPVLCQVSYQDSSSGWVTKPR